MVVNNIEKDSIVNYPKRVFELISSETHYKDESEYFHYTDPNFFN